MSQSDTGILLNTANGTRIISLGDAAGGMVGRWLLRVKDTGSWSGSIVPRKTTKDSPEADTASLPQCAYRNEAAQSDVNNATAITADGLYAIYADGCRVILDYTHTSGSAVIYAQPVRG